MWEFLPTCLTQWGYSECYACMGPNVPPLIGPSPSSNGPPWALMGQALMGPGLSWAGP